MKEFEYFLFENFDADEESQNPNNPRNFLGKETDAIISLIAQKPANTCTYSHCCAESNTCLVKKLISGGILRLDGTILNFDCPVFLRDECRHFRYCRNRAHSAGHQSGSFTDSGKTRCICPTGLNSKSSPNRISP